VRPLPGSYLALGAAQVKMEFRYIIGRLVICCHYSRSRSGVIRLLSRHLKRNSNPGGSDVSHYKMMIVSQDG
jgi:hypothetical protein